MSAQAIPYDMSAESLLTGTSEERESQAVLMLELGYIHAGQNSKDYAPVENVCMTRGQTKWLPHPYIHKGIAASLHDPVHYGELLDHVIPYFQAAYDSAPAGSDVRAEAQRALYFKQQEQKYYNMSPREQASTALYQALGSTDPALYLSLYGKSMLKAAKLDPIETANEAFRVFVTTRLGWVGGKKEQESDYPIRAIALDIINSAGTILVRNPKLGGPEAAIALTDEMVAQREAFHGWAYGGWRERGYKEADPLYAVIINIREVAVKTQTEMAVAKALAQYDAGTEATRYQMFERLLDPETAANKSIPQGAEVTVPVDLLIASKHLGQMSVTRLQAELAEYDSSSSPVVAKNVMQ